MAKPYRTLRAQMAPDAQQQAEDKARALLAEDTDTAPCNLCGILTPTDWLQPEAYQEWDALCPRCFCRATAHSWHVHARAQARPGAHQQDPQP